MKEQELPPMPPHENRLFNTDPAGPSEDGISRLSIFFFIGAIGWFFFTAAYAVDKGQELQNAAPGLIWAGALVYFAFSLRKKTAQGRKILATVFSLLNVVLPPFLIGNLIISPPAKTPAASRALSITQPRPQPQDTNVKGHYRTTKDGKKVYVQPHKRRKEKN